MFHEKQVISRVLKGDFRAFEELVKQYERMVFFVVNRLVTGREDKEDICQEVFIKVHRGLSGFSFSSSLGTWIARIAYLTAVDHVKKNDRYKKNPYPEHPEDFDFVEEDDPEQLLTKKDLIQYIEKLIAKMPENYRISLTLYHLKEFSIQEIQTITGIPETTIKTYLFRGRKLLKERVGKHFKRDDI